jgi:hypothetical protein
MSELTLPEFKELAEGISALATTIAVFAGGLWTYQLFVKNREKYPRASISHNVSHIDLSVDVRVVSVAVTVSNAGKVLLQIQKLECRLLQLLPPAGSIATHLESPSNLINNGHQKIAWPMLDRRTWNYAQGESELEPGEVETFNCDFVIGHDVHVVQVYSHLANVTKGIIGWSCSSRFDFEEPNVAHTSVKRADIAK